MNEAGSENSRLEGSQTRRAERIRRSEVRKLRWRVSGVPRAAAGKDGPWPSGPDKNGEASVSGLLLDVLDGLVNSSMR
jgi:hypothetical protein